METNPYTKNRASGSLQDEMSPCVSPENIPSLPPEVNLTDCSWPFLGSFAVHLLLVTALLCPLFQYPSSIGNQTATVFWFSPLSSPESGEDLHGPSIAFAAEQEPPVRESGRQSLAKGDNPVRTEYQESAPESPAAEAELTVAAPLPAKKSAGPGKSVKPTPETAGRHTPLPESAPVKNISVPLEAEPKSPRALPATQPAMTKVAEKQFSGNEKSLQKEDDQIQRQISEQRQRAAERSRREQAVREEELRAIEERSEVERAAAIKARQREVANENELKKRRLREEALHKLETERTVRVKAERDTSAISLPLNKPAPQESKKAPEPQSPVKPPEKPMSVGLPSIKGDLKLVIAGSIQPEISITFVDFAQSRRDRPLSRGEARRKTKIAPIIANIRDTTREAVITRASPGVYTVTAISAAGAATVSLSLKLYEGTPRGVARDLGKFTITGRKVLFKLLMPNGILWDDNGAFSGNMEDSDGVTKFNSETGLMWKEYE